MVENAVKTICPKNLLPPPFGLIHRTHLKVEVWQQRPEKQRQCTFIGCTNVLPIYTNTHGKMWFLHKTKSLIYCLLVSPAQHLLPFWLCNGMWSTQLCGSSLTSLVGCTTSPSPVGAEGRIPAQADWSPPSFVKTHVQKKTQNTTAWVQRGDQSYFKCEIFQNEIYCTFSFYLSEFLLATPTKKQS